MNSNQELQVKAYGQENSGRIGTLEARVAWSGVWEGTEAQEAEVMRVLNFRPIGRPTIT